MNVMLTRPHSLLVVIGHVPTMECEPNWRKMIEFCRAHKAIIDGEKPFTKSIEQTDLTDSDIDMDI